MQILTVAALVVVTLGVGVVLSAAVLRLVLTGLLRGRGLHERPYDRIGDPLAHSREGH